MHWCTILCTLVFALQSQRTGGTVDWVRTIESIAKQDRETKVEDVEVCVMTNASSKVAPMMDQLLKVLIANYPTTYLRSEYTLSIYRKAATLVIIDATGNEREFPEKMIKRHFQKHPCYTITAKFFLFVDYVWYEQKHILVQFFDSLGIVNYLIAPVGAQPNGTGILYTQNRFSKEELWISNGTPPERHFPDKLRNLHGYRIRVHSRQEFPYVMYYGGRFLGTLASFMYNVCNIRLNASVTIVEERDPGLDAWFNAGEFRERNANELALKEMSGMCLLCPFHTERNFLRHLLQPFSVGIWLILAGMLALCVVLRHLFPRIYHCDMIVLTFFGGNITEHREPFSFRSVAFMLTVTLFYLSESYNAKIISLMATSKYYDVPTTVDEFRQSKLLVAIPDLDLRELNDQIGGNKIIDYRLATELYEERGLALYQEYCTIMICGDGLYLTKLGWEHNDVYLYLVDQKVVPDLLMLQFAENSPLFEAFQQPFDWYYESGVWSFHVQELMSALQNSPWNQETFAETVFFFEDLVCVWILTMAGWGISCVAFVGELLWVRMKARRAARSGAAPDVV